MRKSTAWIVALVLAVGCGRTSEPTTTTRPTTTTSSTPISTPTLRPTATAMPSCRYAFPVEPATATSYSRSHHDYPATDIFAPRGSPFVAPTSGVVDFVARTDAWEPTNDDPALRGGLSVAVIGDDGVRYYGSHLEDVATEATVGDRVDVGTLLGHVGSSGNARGIDPHLHFGISRPTTPDDWKARRGEIWPYDYLDAWKAGRALTPSVDKVDTVHCAIVH